MRLAQKDPLAGFHEEVREAVIRATALVADQPKERLVVIDPDSGDILFTNTGTTSHVGAGPGYRRAITVHNHPSGDAPFSRGDLALMVNNDEVASIVVAANRTYVLRPPKRGWAVEVRRRPDAARLLDPAGTTGQRSAPFRLCLAFVAATGARYWDLPRSGRAGVRWIQAPGQGAQRVWPC